MAYAGGYDPRKIGTGGVYGSRSYRPPAPTSGDPDYVVTDIDGNRVGGVRNTAYLNPQSEGVGGWYENVGGTMRNARAPIYGPGSFGLPPGGLPPGGYPSGSSGGSSGGSGGGGEIDIGSILGLLGKKPQQYQWNDLAHQEYVPSKFREFNSGVYDTARSGLTSAVTADRAAGNASYDQGLTELQQYVNPFNAPSTVSNPEQSAAMQRMMQANGTPTNINQADTNRGVQADAAFGNVMALLAGVNDQAQASRLRALAGDRRGFGERLDAEQRGGTLMVNMSEAKARDLYEQERWQFGEQVAQQNYAARTQNAQYNNTGQNQTAQQNTQQGNEWQQGSIQAIIDMIASGQQIDPALLAQWTGA